MPYKDPEIRRAYLKQWQERNRERQAEYRRNWQRENRDHRIAYSRSYYAARVQRDPEGVRATKHREWLSSKYRLTKAQYDALVETQGNRCAVCGDPPARGKRLHVDHDHTTNAVRGLLCSRCNQGIGFFRDAPDLLKRAATYLLERVPA